MQSEDKRYDELTQWLFGQIPMFQNEGAKAYKPGLYNIERLAEAFGNPHTGFKSIHVAGTNGKGSTSSLLASVMTEGGLRTGLFTSPHLIDFRERMRVDGEMISKAEVVDFIERYRGMELGFEPSFFELTTVMAFEWFARRGVDVAVVETGLGGRLDSTNIITPAISVITNISLDHTALLGHTEPEIAVEKAGIIKPGVPAVIGRASGAVRQVFEQKAAECGSAIDFACDHILYASADEFGGTVRYTGTPWGDLECALTGHVQAENANTALHTLRAMGFTDAEAVRRGFASVTRNTGLRGRWELLSTSPAVICDTGHNPDGWRFNGARLRQMARDGQLHMVIGFVNDKDIDSILGEMPREATYYFATPSVKRGRPAEETAAAAAAHGLAGRTYGSVAEAYAAAMAAAGKDDSVFVGGSTFVVADLLGIMAHNES